jgi:hypothetical protein
MCAELAYRGLLANYQKEQKARKDLFNQIQELKGESGPLVP